MSAREKAIEAIADRMVRGGYVLDRGEATEAVDRLELAGLVIVLASEPNLTTTRAVAFARRVLSLFVDQQDGDRVRFVSKLEQGEFTDLLRELRSIERGRG